MGRAKQRGTKEERVAKGKIKREIELSHGEAIEEYWKRIQKANRVKFNVTETGRTSMRKPSIALHCALLLGATAIYGNGPGSI